MTQNEVFVKWLDAEMEERGWSKAELARRASINDGHVSRLLNGDQRPGIETLQAVARAFELPLFEVYVQAGLLPPDSERSALIERIVEVLQQLPEAEQEEMLAMARLKAERTKREKRGRKTVGS